MPHPSPRPSPDREPEYSEELRRASHRTLLARPEVRACSAEQQESLTELHDVLLEGDTDAMRLAMEGIPELLVPAPPSCFELPELQDAAMSCLRVALLGADVADARTLLDGFPLSAERRAQAFRLARAYHTEHDDRASLRVLTEAFGEEPGLREEN